jgi:exodeoxyribonuclease VII small subunit
MRSSRLRCRELPDDIVSCPDVRPHINSERMNFEASLRRLDEILAALEDQQVGLDDSLKLFEEGVELLRTASAELGRAETKVQMLLEKSDGGFELREMDL